MSTLGVTKEQAVPATTWHLIRFDDAGVPGRQPNIRATTNSSFDPATMDGDDSDRTAAQSFIGLRTSYRRLDPAANYRLEISHGTPAGEPRVQSIHVNGVQVDPPRALPIGHVETCSFDLEQRPDPDGRLAVSFVGHAPPELAGRVEEVGEPPMVTRVALYADRPCGPFLLDAATLPDGGIGVAVSSVPELTPIADVSVRITFPEAGITTDLQTDERGEACLLLAERAASITPGSTVEVHATVGEVTDRMSLTTDDTFHSGWPALSIPPAAGFDNSAERSLDGVWRFHPDPPADATDPSADTEGWHDINVPAQWVQEGFDVAPGTAACYRREVSLSPEANRRYVLRFDAVYAHARVIVNGAAVRTHEGGFTPFEVDVTDELVDGVNVIAVLAQSDSISDVVSAASDYAAHQLGGITRSVRLLEFPELHLSRLHVDTRFVDNGPDAVARVLGQVQGLGADREATVEFAVRDGEGTIVATATTEVTADRTRFIKEIPVAAPQPWTAESPSRYQVVATIQPGGPSAVRDLGFREVAVVGNALQVNGQPIRLRGVERHEQDPLRGRSTQPDLWQQDVDLMKGANVNNVFTCHYPHPEGFLELCDRDGLWVIDESPTVWVTADVADDPAAFLALCTPILEMIERDWSRPSIVIWMLGDECLWGHNFWRLVLWLRQQGLTTPLMFSFDIGGQSSLDVASRHYPPVDYGPRITGVTSPVTFDQYYHVNCYNRREAFTDPGVRDWWGLGFEEMWEAMYADPGILGGQIWAWSDDEFFLDRTTMIGYGQWGIVDSWRRPKPEWWHMRQVYTPIKVLTTHLEPGIDTATIEVHNRYDFTDLDRITARWSLGDRSGEVRGRGAPHERSELTIALPRTLTGGDVLHLDFVDGDGRCVIEARLPVGDRTTVTEPSPMADGPVTVEVQQRAKVFAPNLPEYDAWLVRCGERGWLLDQEEGLIRAGRLGRQTIISGGPHLMLLPSTATQHVGPHHRLAIEPFTDVCHGRTIASVRGDESEHGFRVRSEVSYDEADAVIDLLVGPDGTLTIDYRAELRQDIDLRQVGVAVDVLPFHDTLAWVRRGQWSVYPDDHIGRLEGRVRATTGPNGRAGLRPQQPWSADLTALGSADFRATRHDVINFGLHDDDGVGVGIEPVGPTDGRAWVHGDVIRLLSASYTSGGSEPILARADHTLAARRMLVAGDIVSGSAKLRLGRWSDPASG
jgi:beta-galactosidase